MAVWLVRAGRNGEREQLALDQSVAVIGWQALPDLTPITTREALDQLVRATYPEFKPGKLSNHIGQVWAFRERIQVGDLVVLPLKTRSAIAIGRVAGPYSYRADLPPEAKHTRPLQWLRTDLPRDAFDQDLLFSFGSQLTICQVQRNQAEPRIAAVLAGKPAPVPKPVPPDGGGEALVDTAAPLNLEEFATDQIRAYVGQRFKGHGLARLVAELLRAQGYQAQISTPGPDGGVDVIAGAGPMGFDAPHLCVQVKSSDQPLDVKELRELQGVLKNFGAQQGLLVSWGGFKQTVLAEARRLYFEIRLWDAGDLVSVLQTHYDRLPADLQAELPLKRIWTLVSEEE
jgi:restriction system protein